jgi:DNA polymerase
VPIYEYVCMECESHFEELVRNGEQPDCPDCASSNVRKQFSVFATHGTAEQPTFGGSSGRLLRRFVWLRPLTAADRARGVRAPGRGVHEVPPREGRTQVVFGVGDPEADLMFVGEAPGFHEDKQGYPFVGQAGKLLDKLLGGIGLERSNVYIANVLKCRPPGKPRPGPDEIQACEGPPLPADRADPPEGRRDARQLRDEAALGQADGDHARARAEQEVTLGGSRVLLYPLYHPAAALYTPAMLQVLEQDFARLPELLGASRGSSAPDAAADAGAPEPAGQPSSSASSRHMQVRSASPAETEAVAAALAAELARATWSRSPASLVAARRPFVRGACRALGVTVR